MTPLFHLCHEIFGHMDDGWKRANLYAPFTPLKMGAQNAEVLLGVQNKLYQG